MKWSFLPVELIHFFQVLLGESPGSLPLICEPTIAGLAAVMEVCHIQQHYWKIDPVSIMTMRSQFRSRVKGKWLILLGFSRCRRYFLVMISTFRKDASSDDIQTTHHVQHILNGQLSHVQKN